MGSLGRKTAEKKSVLKDRHVVLSLGHDRMKTEFI